MLYSKAQLTQHFSIITISRGRRYADEGHVSHVLLMPTQDSSQPNIISRVQGQRRSPYDVLIGWDGDQIDGHCSCPMAHNCKHVVATLIVWQRQEGHEPPSWTRPKSTLDERLEYSTRCWVDQLSQSLSSQENHEVIIYLMKQPPHSPYDAPGVLTVSTYIARQLKKGGFGRPKPFYPSTDLKKARATKDDLEIYGLLDISGDNHRSTRGEYFILQNTHDRFFERMIETGRCYWESIDNPPLKKKLEPTSAKLSWQLEHDGAQRLMCLADNGQPLLNTLALTPAWYVDAQKSEVSLLDTSLPDPATTTLLSAPRITVNQAKQCTAHLKNITNGNVSIPLPQTFKKVKQKRLKPKPTLQVYPKNITLEEESVPYPMQIEEPCILADLKFKYGKHTISLDDPSRASVAYVENDQLIQITRNLELENQYLSRIKALARPQTRGIHSIQQKGKTHLLIGKQSDTDAAIHFGESIVPALKADNWDLQFDPNQFYDLLEIDEWYTELDEESEYNWFDMNLGVLVDGEKINLLPHLIKAIDRLEWSNGKEPYYVKLTKGKVLPIPAERIKRIMGVLTQFIDPRRLEMGDTSLKISRYNAALLTEIDQAFQKTRLRWMGGDRLRDLGKRLSGFTKIQSIQLPQHSFSAELRPYQQQGVNWLQFLREYELGGILADDMGLGKTLQALAHILIEKEKGRLTQPCLIIAPTSVVSNWKLEAQRFTPSLQTLVLRGPERKKDFDHISKNDIVLTTYPLLVRDKTDLLRHQYYMVVLDEAQYVKNSKAKMTQIVQQFQAKHRLCLTGTPLENHLGELWSLFNFLMPGLLGNLKDFKKYYRTPIEKNKDKVSVERLTKIVKPFMLRRTKGEVATDLPQKMEMIQKITLDTQQRDLYESLRLTMHKKVRDAIDKKGIERCQIIILDALLKLRQACCDPRLVKLAAAQKVQGSAKLSMLSDMLSSMVDEGRKILIFSQFTSMLSLIEDKLKIQEIDYVKLTGNTKNRAQPIQQFQTGQTPVFLISLRAGGTGINLTAADTVIHYDPWWNPAVESQATDRAYRIGQKQSVFVYKLVVENTVEEKILEMQEKKRALMTALFSGEKNIAVLTKKDLEFLLA